MTLIIENLGLAGASCKSCPPHTQNLVKGYMKSIDEHLDDLEYVIEHFGQLPGFTGTNSMINEMATNGGTGWAKADGGAFIMHYIRNNPTKFSKLSAFEYRYHDHWLNSADVLVNTIKYEMKSWTKGGDGWKDLFSRRGASYNQFKRYLQNTTKLSDLKYVFNKAKVSESEVKNAFKGLFSEELEKQEIFAAMSEELRIDLFGDSEALQFNRFNLQIADQESQLYSFISN